MPRGLGHLVGLPLDIRDAAAGAARRCEHAANTQPPPFSHSCEHAAPPPPLFAGTPYALLADGTRLSAMHVKDTAHSPNLYGTHFYTLEPTPPFRIRSISPKVCFSERQIELAISSRCALQYVTGLHVDEGSDLALVSYGEMDASMKLAALPLTQVLALARTHTIDEDGQTMSECMRLE